MNLDEIKYDDKGMVAAVAQDALNGQVLMFAYANKEALKKTIETNKAHYWSRSRQKLWMKGEESGHVQDVQDVFYDCDMDAVLYVVKQTGVACHTGERTCFYRSLTSDDDAAAPSYNQDMNTKTLDEVYNVIIDRKQNPKDDSYVSGLFDKGIDSILKKVGEEAGEAIIGAKNKDKNELIYETADLWFHSMIALAYFDLSPKDIYKELGRRFGKKKEDYGQ